MAGQRALWPGSGNRADPQTLAEFVIAAWDSSRKAVETLGAGRALASLDQFEVADFWLIGTNDEQIANTALNLYEARVNLKGSIVFHLCGRHGTEILEPLTESQCGLAAVHPVRSLTHEQISPGDF